MVIPVSRYLMDTRSKSLHRPVINSMPQSNLTGASRIGSFNSLYRTFWSRFKNSPEMYGIINILATDILGDRPTFRAPDGKTLGRNKSMEAFRFWRQNRIKESLKAILFDMFITGDGYGWKAKATDDERINAVKEVMRRYSLSLKEAEFSQIFLKAIQDEDLRLPKKFDYIASSTVQIESSPYEITGYVQMAGGETVQFNPKEVIHFRLNTVDGNIQGFSPMESLVKEWALLYYVKGNMIAYLQNGGRADLLFAMKNTQPGSDPYTKFEQMLRSYKQVENSHGILLSTGETMVTDLNFGKQKDMEYQNLALWVLSGMLFTFGIPISRVPFLVGKSATSGDNGGLAEAGYQAMISEKQDYIEDLMNTQLFEELGWHLLLNRHYKQDAVREAQVLQQNVDSVSKMQSVYRSIGYKIKTEKIGEILGISLDDLEEMTPEEQMQFQNPQLPGDDRQMLNDDKSVQKEPDNRKRAETKRKAAIQSQSNRGQGA